MDNTGSQAARPSRDSVESDPDYDFADDAPVEDSETVEEELLEEADQRLPLDTEDFLGEDQPVGSPDADEFRGPEDGG
ncbi:hypothetical protein ABC337_03925 [Arthrobacter sp. 1P04PC]|jgi:hypothetical protein|uniref:hypothetical protein n=1 Tax=Micrococcaceae TaxID=1268 RepID=UPI003438BAA5